MSSSRESSMYVLLIALNLTQQPSSSPDSRTSVSVPRVDTVGTGTDARVRCLGADSHELSTMTCEPVRSTVAASLSEACQSERSSVSASEETIFWAGLIAESGWCGLQDRLLEK